MSFERNSVRKNLILSAFLCWESRFSLRETDQKFKFSGNIGYGNTYLESFFRRFKLFRLHAKLQDVAGAVRVHSGKGPGNCYMFGRGPNSCFLGHVTGLLFCLGVKFFLPSIFNSVEFWSGMSCLLIETELVDENFFKELGVIYWWQGSGILNSSSKIVQTYKTSVLVHKKLARNRVEQWTFGKQWALKHSS